MSADYGDRIHKIASRLWAEAMNDTDYNYTPFALRIDVDGWKLLMNSRGAYEDQSFDRFAHPDKYLWRGLQRIMVHEPVSTHVLRDVKMDEIIPFECKMLCIEARQPGEHGRRKYYDATADELAEAFKGEA